MHDGRLVPLWVAVFTLGTVRTLTAVRTVLCLGRQS